MHLLGLVLDVHKRIRAVFTRRGFIFLVIQWSLSRVMKLTEVLKQSSKHRERNSKRHHTHEGADGHFPLPTELRKKLVPNFAARLRQEKGPVHPERLFLRLSKVIFGDHSRVSFLRERHHRRHFRRHSLPVWRRGWHRRPFAAEWSLDISSVQHSIRLWSLVLADTLLRADHSRCVSCRTSWLSLERSVVIATISNTGSSSATCTT